MSAKPKSNELKLSRLYDAPVQVVWDAFTDPEQIKHWYGPRGHTITTHHKDPLRPGATWSYTMHAPDGTDFHNKTVYLEVDPGKRIVYDHGGNDDRPALFRVEVLFTPEGKKTRLDLTMTFESAERAKEIGKFIKLANGNSTWDRFAEFIEHKETGREQFVINRSFDAPIDVVFDMWIKPEHFAKWLGPTGSTMGFFASDVREGGVNHYWMTMGETKLFGKIYYREIVRPTRLVYTQQFCDEAGNISRHPLAPIWPETKLTTVTLCEEPMGSTRVTVVWEAFGPTTPEELAAFTSARAGMTQGWTGSFDKLEELLAETT